MQITILLKAELTSLKNGTNAIYYQYFCWLIFCWTTNQLTDFQLQFNFPILCLVLPRKGTVFSSFHFPLGICLVHLKGMRRADVIGHYYRSPQLRLMYSASPAIFSPLWATFAPLVTKPTKNELVTQVCMHPEFELAPKWKRFEVSVSN